MCRKKNDRCDFALFADLSLTVLRPFDDYATFVLKGYCMRGSGYYRLAAIMSRWVGPGNAKGCYAKDSRRRRRLHTSRLVR